MVQPFRHRISVSYFEVDAQGVVFNMWYLGWFDDAMTAFLADAGLPYADLMAAGYDCMLVRSEIDWSSGVGFGDEIAVEVAVDRIGTTSFTLAFTVLRDGEPTAVGRTTYVVIALDESGKAAGKQPVPDSLRAALEPRLVTA